MGIDAGDFDNDGDEDLFITNWLAQMNILYVNDGGGVFEDRKAASGLGPPSLAKTGFGTAWFDYDNDGWLDLLAVNGSVSIIEAQARAKDPFPLQDAEPAVSQPRQRPVRGRVGARRAQRSRCSTSAAARRSATSTTTATPTWWSAPPPAGATAGQQRRQPQPLARRCASIGAATAGDMIGARVDRRSCDDRTADAVAPRALRRQLRVGQRPARARRSRRVHRSGAACACSGRTGTTRRVGEVADRSLDDADAQGDRASRLIGQRVMVAASRAGVLLVFGAACGSPTTGAATGARRSLRDVTLPDLVAHGRVGAGAGKRALRGADARSSRGRRVRTTSSARRTASRHAAARRRVLRGRRARLPERAGC